MRGRCSANLFVDDEVLAAEGVTDLTGYSPAGFTGEPALDIFVDPGVPATRNEE